LVKKQEGDWESFRPEKKKNKRGRKEERRPEKDRKKWMVMVKEKRPGKTSTQRKASGGQLTRGGEDGREDWYNVCGVRSSLYLRKKERGWNQN